jgi:hypothetical protein
MNEKKRLKRRISAVCLMFMSGCGLVETLLRAERFWVVQMVCMNSIERVCCWLRYSSHTQATILTTRRTTSAPQLHPSTTSSIRGILLYQASSSIIKLPWLLMLWPASSGAEGEDNYLFFPAHHSRWVHNTNPIVIPKLRRQELIMDS